MSNDLSWNDAREARLDRAIDRAVREIMQIDPPPGLRRRVLAQLSVPSHRRGFLFTRYALAGGSIVALLLVVGLVTQLFDQVEPPAPPKPPAMATMTAVPTVDPSTIRIEFNGKPIPGQVTKEPIRMPQVTNVFGTRNNGATAATVRDNERATAKVLEGLAPLGIVPLSARPIVIEPLVIRALPKDRQ